MNPAAPVTRYDPSHAESDDEPEAAVERAVVVVEARDAALALRIFIRTGCPLEGFERLARSRGAGAAAAWAAPAPKGEAQGSIAHDPFTVEGREVKRRSRLTIRRTRRALCIDTVFVRDSFAGKYLLTCTYS